MTKQTMRWITESFIIVFTNQTASCQNCVFLIRKLHYKARINYYYYYSQNYISFNHNWKVILISLGLWSLWIDPVQWYCTLIYLNILFVLDCCPGLVSKGNLSRPVTAQKIACFLMISLTNCLYFIDQFQKLPSKFYLIPYLYFYLAARGIRP